MRVAALIPHATAAELLPENMGGSEAVEGHEEAGGGGGSDQPVLEMGQIIQVKSKTLGRFKEVRDILMGEHRSEWNQVVVQGMVTGKVKNDKYIVDWNISGQKVRLCVKGHVLARKRLYDASSASLNRSAGQNAQAGSDDGSTGMVGADPEDDASVGDEHDTIPAETVSALQCDSADEALQWDACENGVQTDQRRALGFEFATTTFNWPESMRSADPKTEFDCWKLMFPWQFFFGKSRKNGSCLQWTNDSLPATVDPFTECEFLQYLGVVYTKALFPKGNFLHLWGSGNGELIRAPDLGTRYKVSQDRFELWVKHVKLCSPEYENGHESTECMYPLIDAFNRNRVQSIRAGTELFVFEDVDLRSISNEYTSRSRSTLNGAASICKRAGIEYTKLAECTFGITLALEPRRELGMELDVSSSAATLISVAKKYLDKGHVIHGSSGFSSVVIAKALLSRQTFFTGLLRKSPPGFPKKFLKADAEASGEQQGATRTATAQVELQGKMRLIYGHGWIESGLSGKEKRLLVSTWNTTDKSEVRSEDSVSARKSGADSWQAPASKVMSSYFTAATKIYLSKHNDQDELEQESSIGKQNCQLAMLCDVLRTMELDAFKVYCASNPSGGPVRHIVYTEALCTQLLTSGTDSSHSQGKANSTCDGGVSQIMDIDDSGDSSKGIHTLGLVNDHVIKWNLRTSQSFDEKRAIRVRCRVSRRIATNGLMDCVGRPHAGNVIQNM
ncbi:hypothetical protein GUITHDRAFT_109975 [Guillardia theta CCMP2712]|uniref:PiggyBac transposable element-derived protein domain-containing protein n=1 Tax=Guillardia theta (strain CCMP2712) TaxID=905079 RepID=L1J7Y7_GUITC|nr:hypothetical protein GUITHDRAFT_109975 [Guillardia theta CCMP2712]EKX44190.1 hypothetical protein GUITHDRAFT_109975 [Guillardia theta CCMP2712]|eukprot:XP_005831170.1 hypothetical protein GUITHDRAFT_109975 [Guillardia theta CCMP2712]